MGVVGNGRIVQSRQSCVEMGGGIVCEPGPKADRGGDHAHGERDGYGEKAVSGVFRGKWHETIVQYFGGAMRVGDVVRQRIVVDVFST
jgi:hypothetical protein